MSKIKSMTGFASQSQKYNEHEVGCELRALNSRYLEVSVKLPHFLKDMEDMIKELIRNKVSRGKINCIINCKSNSSNYQNLMVNEQIVDFYRSILEQIKKTAKLDGEIKLEHMLFFKDIISFEEEIVIEKKLEEGVIDIVNTTLDNLNDSRIEEGKNLKEDLADRLSSIHDKLRFIEKYAKKNARNEFQKLQKRLFSMVDQQKIDPNRLEMELALISDRVDITEEMVRLKSHLDLFQENLYQGSPIGKKLNFILQEMHRESNTIAAKSTAIQVSHHIVSIKEEIERVREQVQNIE
jgi:uncharacterized protein (TIGR00255 family)